MNININFNKKMAGTIAIILVASVVVGAIGAFAWLKYEVSKAKAIIASQIPGLEKYQVIGPGVYTSPETFRIGDARGSSYVVGRLGESGYVDSSTSNCERCFTWNKATGRLVVKHSKNNSGLEPVYQNGAVTVIFGNRTITSISGANELIIPPKFLRQNDDTSRKNASGSENQRLKNAITAAEDKRFFEHSGMDWIALGKALISQASLSDDVKSHGTSITQQLAKGLLLENMPRGWQKQYKAMIYALALEEMIGDKEKIFQLYINHVYLGPDCYGFTSAAQKYFCVGLEQASDEQCAALAGKLRNPGAYEPGKKEGKVNWVKRTNQVLAAMGNGKSVDDTFLSKGSCAIARAKPFVRYVWDQVSDVNFGGRIETTIQPYMQMVLEDAIRSAENLPQPSGGKLGTQMLGVIIDPKTGDILAEAQRGAYQGNLIEYRFTIGSSGKPFVYAEALSIDENGLNDPLPDSDEHEYNGFIPKNYDNKYMGQISWYEALVKSRNPPVVFVGSVIGFDKVMNRFKDIGFGGVPGPNPAITEGQFGANALELALAYSVFANLGKKPLAANGIRAVISSTGTTKGNNPAFSSHFTEPALLKVNAALRDVFIDGTGASSGKILGEYRGKVIGKTGSATEGVVVVMCTENLVLVLWAGSVENKPLKGTAGKTVAPIASKILLRILGAMPQYIGNIRYDDSVETELQELQSPVEEVVPANTETETSEPKPFGETRPRIFKPPTESGQPLPDEKPNH